MSDEERALAARNYNPEEGKLIASIKWLITRIYENKGIPDKLQNPFFRTNEVQAASKILHDNSLLTQSHGAILRALSSLEIEVREHDGTLVTETLLFSTDPFLINAHLAMLDALMTAHVKSIVSIERVVQAVSEYTMVDKREEPLDFLDALLFWINKICLLVRDDVERHDVPLKGADNCDPTIPEMEDLYEDLCDGTCICALVAFYRPNELNLQEISFNDPISIQDCRYNLDLLKNALDGLPWSPFHFEIDDILYLHESLQPNVNAFLADLFHFFEPIPIQSPVHVTSPTQRRFVPIEGIPDLRASNIAARPVHPPRMRNTVGLSQRDRTMSVASADSHLTSMSGDSLRYSSQRPTTLPANANIMNFRHLHQSNNNGNGEQGDLNTIVEPSHSDHHMASVRLAMQERRREYDRKRYVENSMNEEERQKAGKDAFFKLMNKSMEKGAELGKLNNESPFNSAREEQLSSQVQNLQQQIDQMNIKKYSGLSHAISQPAIHNDVMPGDEMGYGTTMPNFARVPHNQQQQQMMPGGVNMENPLSGRRSMFSLPYATLQSPTQIPNPGYYENSPYALPNMNTSPRYPNAYHLPAQQMATLPNMPLSSIPTQSQPYLPYGPGGSALPHMVNQTTFPSVSQTGYSPMAYYTPNAGMSMSMYEPRQQPFYAQIPPPMIHPSLNNQNQPFMDEMNPVPNANTFHLHQSNASSSRLDPPLELNRNLTNWGLTYHGENRPQRKTWTTPSQPQNDVQKQTIEHFSNASKFSNDATTLSQSVISNPDDPSKPVSKPETQGQHQQSPPKDPEFRSPTKENFANNSTTPKKSESAVLKDLGSTSASELTPEMQAKRDALYANLLKRKEQVEEIVAEKEAKLAEKRMEEQRKQEMADQKKLEKEMRRQKVLEDYKRKKIEQELGESFSGNSSARGSNSSSSGLSRGHSQPPFGRPKSQSNLGEVHARTLQRHNRAQSNFKNEENGQPRIFVPSIAEPSLKLFAKKPPKSNRSLIINAIQYSVFPGTVTSEQRIKVQEALASSDSKHFLILFRDQKCQYRGLYTWDTMSDTAHKIHGTGPKVCKEEMLTLMFKYDAGAKAFKPIQGMKHLSLTTDAFTIEDHYWQKTTIPHSGAR